MRRGEWAEAAPVSGIECVGIVKSCPSGEFAVGSKLPLYWAVSEEPSMAAMPNTRVPMLPAWYRLSLQLAEGNCRKQPKIEAFQKIARLFSEVASLPGSARLRA